MTTELSTLIKVDLTKPYCQCWFKTNHPSPDTKHNVFCPFASADVKAAYVERKVRRALKKLQQACEVSADDSYLTDAVSQCIQILTLNLED